MDILDSAFEELDEMELELLEPTINHILENKSLKWIFVGGKGGVGKTTCSSSIAIRLAKVRESVLIISTDPAHNLSDAFGQKFTHYPTPVEGVERLSAMEIEASLENLDLEEMAKKMGNQAPGGLGGIFGELSSLKEIASSMPGIDEAMSFAEVMKQVQLMKFDVIVFDTAPTGHTLRFLQFPTTLQNTLGKVMQLKNKFSGLFSQMSSMMGVQQNEADMLGKLEETQKVVTEINRQFQDPTLTTFIPVMIPEFLSLYETERLIQDLAKFKIDVHTLVVNQILYPENDSHCRLCNSRSQMQGKYLGQVGLLYEDYHVVKLPLQVQEIRGVQVLNEFSENLVKPFVPQ